MSNIALITAGGIGSRAHQFIPKQFLSIKDKPLIIYTMEKFQNHPEITDIIVVCLDGWTEYLKAMSQQFGISKLKQIVPGGKSGLESIHNGLDFIKTYADDSDIVLIHDGNRPGVSAETISACIAQSGMKDVSITAIGINEAVFTTENAGKTPSLLNRDLLIRTQTPHGIKLGYLNSLFEEAQKKNIQDSVAVCTLLVELDKPIYFCKGSEKNFKVTTPDEVDLFKGMMIIKNEK